MTLDEGHSLLERANAAIAEAKRLAEVNLLWQARINASLKHMYFRASFHPRTLKFLSPLDFSLRRPAYQPFFPTREIDAYANSTQPRKE